MENEVVVSVRDLRKAYGAKVAVDGISLEVVRGEVFGVLGPNGAGKTTTVECAAGLREPDSGTVRVLGRNPATDPSVRHRVGVQLQHAVLPNRMKVREAVQLFASAYLRHADTETLLAEWGLAEHHGAAFAALSGGQKQRLFIALALLGQPEVVVLDELTTGLDPAARRETWSLVRALRARGVSVLLVTHSMDEAEQLCDRLVVIAGGRVVAAGTPAELRGAHSSMESAYLSLTKEAA
ncbi:ABC transporter ATP-binding protein [Allokutzneria sp. NRRL B-24872]|uniref:ABC transporter ATP-binding protein n=1 Tax=Allokutzneria sp. NRRL B-24872 TaxID=1137961 RepID=UPI000A3CB33B|nr:ABC transporter ATP-binding protein [Allokutzneria sp. NRRL B-24872]